MREPKECSVCEKPTKYICVDCLTDKGERIALCEDEKCRGKHKAKCTAPTDNLTYHYAFP